MPSHASAAITPTNPSITGRAAGCEVSSVSSSASFLLGRIFIQAPARRGQGEPESRRGEKRGRWCATDCWFGGPGIGSSSSSTDHGGPRLLFFIACSIYRRAVRRRSQIVLASGSICSQRERSIQFVVGISSIHPHWKP
nr:unnamed protein product [Digitaria exilis]